MIKVMKDNIDRILKWANILFLFLFSLHFCDFSDKLIILWCGFYMLVFATRHKKVGLDKIFWILALAIILNGLGTYYYIREELGYTWGNIIKMVVPTILVYPFMKQVCYKREDKNIEIILLTIAFGTFFYSLLNYYAYLKYGYTEYRIWSEFWTMYPMNATHHSFWGCFIVGLVGYAIGCLAEKKWISGITMMLFIIIENYIQIVVDNRMVLCISILSLAVSALLFVILNIRDKSQIRKLVLIVIAAAIVAAAALVFDLFGIRSSVYFQNFITRDGGIFKNIRFQMIFEAIRLLPSHWKGGATMWTAGWYHVHNYWLQVANVSGIIPFILWMLVNASVVMNVIKVIRNPHIVNRVKYMLIPMLSAIVGYLMMEPGGTESNRYIIFYVMLIALLKQIVQNAEEDNIKKLEC